MINALECIPLAAKMATKNKLLLQNSQTQKHRWTPMGGSFPIGNFPHEKLQEKLLKRIRPTVRNKLTNTMGTVFFPHATHRKIIKY